WKYHIKTILVDRNVEDVAIVGLSGNKCVWATKPGGLLAAISPQEVGLITGQDRKTLLLTGVCDNLLVDEDNMMDVRSKGSDSRNICIGKTPKALIFLMGKKGVHRGALNQKVHSM
ncbi:Profilin-3, partial [Gavia stellata]